LGEKIEKLVQKEFSGASIQTIALAMRLAVLRLECRIIEQQNDSMRIFERDIARSRQKLSSAA